MLSLNQEIAKRIHNAQIDNEDDLSPKGFAVGFGLAALDGLINGCIIGGFLMLAAIPVDGIINLVKKKKG